MPCGPAVNNAISDDTQLPSRNELRPGPLGSEYKVAKLADAAVSTNYSGYLRERPTQWQREHSESANSATTKIWCGIRIRINPDLDVCRIAPKIYRIILLSAWVI